MYEGELTGSDKLSGTVRLDGEKTSDEVIGYFAYFKLLNGYEKTLYISKEDITAYAKHYSPSFNSKYSPWQTEFDKMACKTVLRQLISKYGPTSTEMQKVELTDDSGRTTKQEIKDNANKQMIDITVDEETGEVTLPDDQVNKTFADDLPFDEDD